MRYIDKTESFNEFDDYLKNNPNENWVKNNSWDSFRSRSNPNYVIINKPLYIKLHDFLLKQQKGLCIYCEQRINFKSNGENNDESHIEHVKPKSLYPNLTFIQSNLGVSCQGMIILNLTDQDKIFCGHQKLNRFDEKKFINPFMERDIESYFTYLISGEVKPNAELKDSLKEERANYMINELLNLNDKALVNARQNHYRLIRQKIEDRKNADFLKDYLSENKDLLNSFHCMLKEVFSRFLL